MKSSNPKKSINLKVAHTLAEAKGGKCLSTSYVNNRSKLEWKCSSPEHASWHSSLNNVKDKKSWCPKCAGNVVNPHGLQLAMEYAQAKGGLCLSTGYQSVRTEMEWKCSNKDHMSWFRSYEKVVLAKRWCALCSAANNLCENRVRSIFQKHFGHPFPSARLSWNINPETYNLLELDGYCKEFNVAFEHDGEHHAKIGSRNKLVRELIYQIFRDEQKRKNCKRHGVKLFNIPIIQEKYRANFDKFLEHVVTHCALQGLVMSFTPQQLIELREDFLLI